MDRDVQKHEPENAYHFERPANADATRPVRLPMDAWERQQTFREMVLHLLGNGPLSRRRRRQLVQYAASLDIKAVLAGRLINEARKMFASRGNRTTPPAGACSQAERPMTIRPANSGAPSPVRGVVGIGIGVVVIIMALTVLWGLF